MKALTLEQENKIIKIAQRIAKQTAKQFIEIECGVNTEDEHVSGYSSLLFFMDCLRLPMAEQLVKEDYRRRNNV